MSICEMNCISIIGPFKRLDEVVNICGESKIFQPDNVSSFYSNTENFLPISEENPFTSPLMKLKNTIYSCGAKPEETDISNFHISRSKIDKYVKFISEKVEGLVDEKRKIYGQIASNNEQIEKLKHFYGLDKTLKEILSCEYVKVHFGKIPKNIYARFDDYAEKSKKLGIELVFFAYDSDDEYQWGVYFANLDDADETDRIFSSMHFEEVTLQPDDASPYNRSAQLRNISTELYKEISVIEREISEFWIAQSNKCMSFYNKLLQLNTYFEIKSYAYKYNECFILVGWIPKEKVVEFSGKLNKVSGIEFSFEEGSNLLSNSPPVKLSNKKIFKPFEFFVSTYGMPSYNEIDPTPFVAITYILLFGIMFADLGQGLVVSLLGWLMWKLKNMKLGKILIPCGIASAFFGAIFGSLFGFEHALDPIYHSLFGLEEKPIEVMSPAASGMIIYAAVGLGVILLTVSMALGVYSLIKRKNFGEAIFSSNGICGLIFYSAMVFLIVDMIILHSGISNNPLYIFTFLIIPLLGIMFKEILVKLVEKRKDWKPESWGDYLSQSFFELFEVILSYVTNTMSFLRVGSFVLVHAGMMMVVFTIAQMFGNVGYGITVVVGNLFVIGLEALLAGIQVLRLEFYEMFSKFFEGQGRQFSPVTAKENAE